MKIVTKLTHDMQAELIYSIVPKFSQNDTPGNWGNLEMKNKHRKAERLEKKYLNKSYSNYNYNSYSNADSIIELSHQQ